MKYSKIIDFIKRWKMQILCIGMGFGMYILVTYFVQDTGVIVRNQISREGYGQFDRDYKICVDGLSQEEVILDIPVSKRMYTDREIEKVFIECVEELSTYILQDNHSLQEIKSNLHLPTRMDKYGFRMLWIPEDTDLVDSLGKVYNEDMLEAVDTSLKLQLSDGIHKQEFLISLRILPKQYTEAERKIKEFTDYIKKLDKEQVGDENLSLPLQWRGKNLQYRDANRTNYSVLWILGFFMAALFYVRELANKKEVLEKRNRQLLEDYPEIVSKFMIFIGAGMSIRTAWENIVYDYDRFGMKEQRYAYQEMKKSLNDLKTGMSESKVFKDFGRNTGQKQYMKLASLLEQNKRAGNLGLKSALSVEALSAWEERLTMARRLGEEASTKLLVPLFIMLGIVMCMIMAPAMMTFYG